MRFIKVLFASFAAVIGISILVIVLGSFYFGFEKVDSVIENYLLYAVGIITVIVFPFINKKLSKNLQSTPDQKIVGNPILIKRIFENYGRLQKIEKFSEVLKNLSELEKDFTEFL